MKKNFAEPEMEVVRFNAQEITATSFVVSGGEVQGGVPAAPLPGPGGGGGAPISPIIPG